MTFRETIQLAWKQFSGRQKLKIGAISLLLMSLIFVGGINYFSAWREFRALEAGAAKDKKDAENAMKRAAEIAQIILERENELIKIEERRNEKELELEKSAAETDAALDNVNRARVQPRTDTPSAKQLCAELAELGYPCR